MADGSGVAGAAAATPSVLRRRTRADEGEGAVATGHMCDAGAEVGLHPCPGHKAAALLAQNMKECSRCLGISFQGGLCPVSAEHALSPFSTCKGI